MVHPQFVIIPRNRETAPAYTGFTIGAPVAELKEHSTPQGNGCTIRRGKITNTYNGDRSADIKCDCGTTVSENL